MTIVVLTYNDTHAIYKLSEVPRQKNVAHRYIISCKSLRIVYFVLSDQVTTFTNKLHPHIKLHPLIYQVTSVLPS